VIPNNSKVPMKPSINWNINDVQTIEDISYSRFLPKAWEIYLVAARFRPKFRIPEYPNTASANDRIPNRSGPRPWIMTGTVKSPTKRGRDKPRKLKAVFLIRREPLISYLQKIQANVKFTS